MAIRPLILLSYYQTRKKLNEFEENLGNKIKDFSFEILHKTKEELEKNNEYTPVFLLEEIGNLFDKMRDLNHDEAKELLLIVKELKIRHAYHLYIYYAEFREKHYLSEEKFNSNYFKKLLKDICKGQPDNLKECIASTIYDSMKKKNTDQSSITLDYNFFKTIKDYWKLLFENINQKISDSLMGSLSIILNYNKEYYSKYKTFLYKLIKRNIQDSNVEESFYRPVLMPGIISCISKYCPNDLIDFLLLFLEKGDQVTGYFPFQFEIKNSLISEIKKQKEKISNEKIEQAKKELQKYNISL